MLDLLVKEKEKIEKEIERLNEELSRAIENAEEQYIKVGVIRKDDSVLGRIVSIPQTEAKKHPELSIGMIVVFLKHPRVGATVYLLEYLLRKSKKSGKYYVMALRWCYTENIYKHIEKKIMDLKKQLKVVEKNIRHVIITRALYLIGRGNIDKILHARKEERGLLLRNLLDVIAKKKDVIFVWSRSSEWCLNCSCDV